MIGRSLFPKLAGGYTSMLAPIGALIQSEYRIKYLGPKLVFLPVAPGYSKQKFKIMRHTK